MTEFTHNFFMPRFWVEATKGGYPSKIGDWFSVDFDFYYSFATPYYPDRVDNYCLDPMEVDTDDVLKFVEVINQNQSQIIYHYDILHQLYVGQPVHELTEISYLGALGDLQRLYEKYAGALPSYLLAYDQSWCLAIPYDNDCPFFNLATDYELTSEQLTILLSVFPKYTRLSREGLAHVMSY